MKTIKDFIDYLAQLAQTDADRVAIVDRDGARETTYGELWRMVCRIAGLIGERQKNSDGCRFIPICLPDSMEYLASDYAIWMSGNAAVHMGKSFPQERIDYIMGHCEAEFMIDEAFVAEAMGRDEQTVNYKPLTDNGQPCIMYYTSGSTGNPKGVLLKTKSIMQSYKVHIEMLAPDRYDRFMTIAPCYFAAIVMAYSYLFKGKTVYLISPELKRDVERLERYMEERKIQTAYLGASLLRLIKGIPSELRIAVAAGERLVGGYNGKYDVVNAYGQTETGGVCIFKVLDKNYDNTPIGKPEWGVEICLLDEEGKEVPDGEVGELCIKGGVESPEYYKDPERTAEFLRGGMMHTGDLMKRLPGGDLLFVQRKDWMVKINGQRVEPGESETVMRKIAGVKDAIVKGFTSEDLTRQYMVGYYIAEEGEEITPEYLKREMQKKVPSYMVPQYFVKMESFPLNANNKIDRKSLLPPDFKFGRSEYAAPETALQQSLCEAFSEVLGIDIIGLDDDFFLLGGDSIRFMKLQQTLSDSVPSEVFLRGKITPRIIAEMVEKEETAKQITEDFQQDDYPLSQTQSIFLANALNAPESTASYFPLLYKFSKKIEAERLCKAVEMAVNAHPGLIATIEGDQTKGFRIVPCKERWSVEVERMTDAAMEEEKKKLIRIFKFIGEPLFFARVIETQSAVYLYLQIHHIITDGMSNDILRDDIAKAYGGEEVAEEKVPAYQLNERYERKRGEKIYEECREWFLNEFEGSLSGVDTSVKGEMRSWKKELQIPSHSDLEALCGKKSITLNVLFMACAAYALGRKQNISDVRLSASFHGRTTSDISDTIGFVATPRLYRFHWDQEESVDNYLLRSKTHIMGNMSRPVFTFRDLLKSAHLPADAPIFIYQGTLGSPVLTLDGETGEFKNMDVEAPPTRPLIIFVFDAENERFNISVDYDSSQYDIKDIEQIDEAFELCLNKIMKVETINEI